MMHDLRIGMGKVWEALYQKYVALLLCSLGLSYYTLPKTSKELILLEVHETFVLTISFCFLLNQQNEIELHGCSVF